MSALTPFVVALISFVAADGGARKLNGPLPRAPGGDVVEQRYTPDGTRLVFRADLEHDERFELFSVPAAGGGAPVKLNRALAPGEIVKAGFRMMPGSQRVLFEVGPNDFSNGRLFSAPVDGRAPTVELASGAYLPEVRVSFDGAFLVFQQGANLMAVPTDASAPAFPLHPPLPAGAFVFDLDVSPTANKAVYSAFEGPTGPVDLFAVDIAPGAVPVQLTPPFANGSSLAKYLDNPFQISPDGATVVYRADQRADEDFELFRVPIGGGTAALLSGTIASGGAMDVYVFGIDPTSTWVLFEVGPNGPFNSLYRARLSGSGSPFELRWGVSNWQFDPTGRRVVFSNELFYPFVTRTDLFSRLIDGSAAEVGLGSGGAPFRIDPQGTRVAFTTFDGFTSGFVCGPIDSNAGGVVLPTGPRGVESDLEFSADGADLAYRSDLDVPGMLELYSVPASGGAPRKLNEPLPAGGHVASFAVRPAGATVSFLADLALPTLFESFSVPLLGGPNALQSGSMRNTNLFGSVSAFRTANKHAVYVAHPGDPEHAQLSSVSFAGETLALGAGQLVDPTRLELTPDGKRVLYLTTNTSATDEVELFSSPTDGSSPPARLGLDMRAEGQPLPFQLVPGGQYVAFLSDKRNEDVRELFAGPTDGSFPAIRLSADLVSSGDVVDFAIAQTGGRIVYRADQSTDEVFELFTRSLSSTPVRLSGALTAHGDVTKFQISPDGTFVVYLADQTTDDVFELFRAPIDGSTPAQRLNSTLVSGGDVSGFRIAPDGARVVYLADQISNSKDELFSVPSDASAAPVRLNNNYVIGRVTVQGGFQMRPGNPRVVFIAPLGASDTLGLHSAPIDGSAPATVLVQPFGGIGDMISFQLTPDGTRTVLVAGPGLFIHLYGVPTDGSSAAVQLDDGPAFTGRVSDFRISPDGARVVFLAAPAHSQVRELFLARTDGEGTPYRLDRPLGPLGHVAADFQLTPDGTQVLFRSEDQDPDAFELFIRTIDGHLSGAGEPGE